MKPYDEVYNLCIPLMVWLEQHQMSEWGIVVYCDDVKLIMPKKKDDFAIINKDNNNKNNRKVSNKGIKRIRRGRRK